MAKSPHPQPTRPARPFAFGCDASIFPANEIEVLERLGSRMEALAAGTAQPASPEEEHFLQVDRDEAEPETLAERAWLRLKGRREYEREQRGGTPLAPPETYGMVEFDADRCWW